MKFIDSDINYWVTSDTHFSHRNIVKEISNWNDKNGCRDFPDIESHDNTIVDLINKYVMPDDILFHLGDFSFGGKENIPKFRDRLNVSTIYVCIGNHDKHVPKYKDLFTDIRNMYNIQIHGHRVTLCHYAMRTWYYHNKGSFNLHGHSHSSLSPIGKQLDVGVDEAKKTFGSYRPFKWQEIQKIMSKKDVYIPDGHTTKTNPQ